MVVHILLTILDVLTAFILVSHAIFGWFSPELILYNAIYLIAKGALFALKDFASKVDILVGIYMIAVSFDIFSSTALTIIVSVWLAQKMLLILFNSISKIFF
ncbi:MAG: hypothetical protein HYW24_03385 [Candidatus Aenigmarchaeota archaeon]|nr:hypothetical protein [Candidatus Aenigmarchaeota archaeon]